MTRSPPRSWVRVIRFPPTNVPFVEFRSSISNPRLLLMMRAWCAETEGSEI